MASLVSHALITAGEHLTALARLCPMMGLVQDVVALPGGTLVVLFEPGMPAGSDGFDAFRAAIEGVVPGVTVQAVEARLEDRLSVGRGAFQLLSEALDAMMARRPTPPTVEAEVGSFLVAYRAWQRSVNALRTAVRHADDAQPLMMVN